MSGHFSESTSLLRVTPDKEHLHLRFRSRATRLWCLATPPGRSYLRNSLLAHAQFVGQHMDDGYSSDYVTSLRRWITLVGGRRELSRSNDPDGCSISWGNRQV